MPSNYRGEPERFAVYAGNGRYVADHASDNHSTAPTEIMRLGDAGQALAMARAKAIAVTHGARRAGVSAWIVRHPVGVAA